MTAHPMSPWLRELLEAKGALNGDGISRRATTRYCRTCGIPTIAGLDADVAALAVRCDLTPISTVGEVLSLLAGRRTFDLAWVNGAYRLDGRTEYQIAGDPPDTTRNAVVASHKCGESLPEAAYARRELTVGPRRVEESDVCPF